MSILGKTMEGEHCAFPISVVSASTIKTITIFVLLVAICYNVNNNWMDSLVDELNDIIMCLVVLC